MDMTTKVDISLLGVDVIHDSKKQEINPVNLTIFIVIVFVAIIGSVWGIHTAYSCYSVWSQRKAGEAELSRAESNRQIKSLEAKAVLESAKHLADAEIIRAHGVAEANKIIGDSLKGNESYLRYLWIDGLQNTSGQVIYVPTEANLPILEAGRNK